MCGMNGNSRLDRRGVVGPWSWMDSGELGNVTDIVLPKVLVITRDFIARMTVGIKMTFATTDRLSPSDISSSQRRR